MGSDLFRLGHMGSYGESKGFNLQENNVEILGSNSGVDGGLHKSAPCNPLTMLEPKRLLIDKIQIQSTTTKTKTRKNSLR